MATNPVQNLPGYLESAVISEYTYVLKTDGKLYLYDINTGSLTYLMDYFDPYFHDTNYIYYYGTLYQVDPETGILYEVFTNYSDLFDTYSSFADFINTGNWSGAQLLSPLVPTQEEVNDLIDCLVAGTCNFKDNYIIPYTDGGGNTLKCYCEPGNTTNTWKAALIKNRFYFKKGDVISFLLQVRVNPSNTINGGFTIFDIGSSWAYQGTKLRLIFRNDKLAVELRWLNNEDYLQSGSGTDFPINEWVDIDGKFTLSDEDDGRVEIWQNNNKIIDVNKRTMGWSGFIYNVLECGITANATTSAQITETNVIHINPG